MDTNTQPTGDNKNLPMIITVLGLIALIGVFIYKQSTPNQANPNNQDRDTMERTNDSEPKGSMEQPEASDSMMAKDSKVMEFTVKANNFTYDLKEIKVKKGDKVRINFVNDEGYHDWVLDEFKVATQKYNAGGKETVEFVADKTGTFEYYCSVGKHREMGMKGNLIVE